MTTNNRDDELNLDDDVELPADIAALLGDENTWSEADPAAEDSIVAAIMAEVAAAPMTSGVDTAPSDSALTTTAPVVELRSSRWRAMALGAAAALVLVAGIFGAVQLGSGDEPDLEVAMVGTDLAPAASAQVELTDTPQGTRIVIDVEDLPPAAPGTYYEAWLRKDAAVGVSAGTFHLRAGDDEIELWAGVSVDDYPLLTVTIQQEAQTESSGRVVLRALIGDAVP